MRQKVVSIIEEVGTQWRQSLALFAPSELPLMGFVVIRHSWRTIGRFVTDLWWVPAGILMLFFWRIFEAIGYSSGGVIAASALFQLCVLLLARASVGTQPGSYMVSSCTARVGFVLTVIASLLPSYLLFFPLIPLFLLWAMDAQHYVTAYPRALLNAVHMFVVRMPFFLIIYAAFALVTRVTLELMYRLYFLSPFAQILSFTIFYMLIVIVYEVTLWYGYTRFLRSSMEKYYEA